MAPGCIPGCIIPGCIIPGGITPGCIMPGCIMPGGITPGGIAPGCGAAACCWVASAASCSCGFSLFLGIAGHLPLAWLTGR